MSFLDSALPLIKEQVEDNLRNPVPSDRKLIFTNRIGNPLPHHPKVRNPVSFTKKNSTSNVKQLWSPKAKKFLGNTTPKISANQVDALRRQVQARQEAKSVRDKCVSDTKPSQPNTNIGSVMRTNFRDSTAQTIRKPNHSSLTFENRTVLKRLFS